VSPLAHQQIVRQVEVSQKASIRRISRVLGQRRSSLYYVPKRVNEDAVIGALMQAQAESKVNWGFMMLHHWMRRKGHKWNHKRVYRVYKGLGLNLRKAKHRPKIKRVALNPIAAKRINEGWSMDFLSDSMSHKQGKVRILNILDECSRKALFSFAQKHFTGRKLVKILTGLIQQHGKPSYVRCDNGPEFISKALENFCKKKGIEIKFSQPGKPTQNGLVERLNGTMRLECLNLAQYKTVEAVQRAIDEWWHVYNFERPHSALNYLTPQEFVDQNQALYFISVAA
jgi:putative transposase